MAQVILKRNFNNLRKQCEVSCRCFSGPHTVLQIFIEKIVEAIESFVEKLRVMTRDDLQIWKMKGNDYDYLDDRGKNYNELNYSINNIDLNVILKMQSLYKPSITNSIKKGLLHGIKEELKEPQGSSDVQKKLRYIEQNTKSKEAKEKLRQLSMMSEQEIKFLVEKASEYLKSKKQKLVF